MFPYDGVYFFGDYVRGWLKYITLTPQGTVQSEVTFDNINTPISMDLAPDVSACPRARRVECVFFLVGVFC